MKTGLRDALEEFIRCFPALVITEHADGSATIVGAYALDAEYDEVRLVEDFMLSIDVPAAFPVRIPRVKEISDVISPEYEHMYEDRSFCLGINGELAMGLSENPSLVWFLEIPVKSYLYTALYHARYGRYPYGDRPHGVEGILQFYGDIFNVNNQHSAATLMEFTVKGKYRGHLPCPCESGIKTRNCHGSQLRRFMSEPKRTIVQSDYETIITAIGSEAERRIIPQATFQQNSSLKNNGRYAGTKPAVT